MRIREFEHSYRYVPFGRLTGSNSRIRTPAVEAPKPQRVHRSKRKERNYWTFCQGPPLITSVKPFAFRMLAAEALRMPDAQQVITGLFLSSPLNLAASTSTGIFTAPLACPLLNSCGERTSRTTAPLDFSSAKSMLGLPPRICFRKSNMLYVFLMTQR